MKFLRNLFDDAKPSFSKGGTAEKYFPIYDIFENLFFLSRKPPEFIQKVPTAAQ